MTDNTPDQPVHAASDDTREQTSAEPSSPVKRLLRFSEKPRDAISPNCSRIYQAVTACLLTLCVYGMLWAVFGEAALPGNGVWVVFVIYILACGFGKFTQVLSLPPLIGMLLAGLLVRNLQPLKSYLPVPSEHLSATLRNLAFTAILIRAGLGLDVVSLRRNSRAVALLALIPGSLVEAPVVALFSYLLLDLPVIWGLMLGFILAAVSPAVVVPSLLSLQSRGLGVAEGVPSIVIAAASVDDIVAICAFSVTMSITFSEGNLVWTIVSAPLQVISGVAVGIVTGVLFWLIPHNSHRHRDTLRFTLLYIVSCAYLLGSNRVEFGGAGALAVLTTSLVAGMGWKMEKNVLESWFGLLWLILMPFLFGLVGAEIDLLVIVPSQLGLSLVVIVVGLGARVMASYFCAWGEKLGRGEKLFIAIAWVPKATVQAAIGSLPLDAVRRQASPSQEDDDRGYLLLTTAVVVILLTAPAGAFAIQCAGSRLLKPALPRDLAEIRISRDLAETRGSRDLVDTRIPREGTEEDAPAVESHS